MSKKTAISIMAAVVVVVYLLLLVGLPALTEVVSTYPVDEPEAFATPTIMYFVPGVIGALVIIAIWKSKKEVREDG